MPVRLGFLLAALAAGALACSDPAPPPAADSGNDTSTMDATAGDSATPCASETECDDGLFCNGAELCTDGLCAPGEAPDCDDAVACTADSCSEDDRECVNEAPDADDDGVTDAACLGTDGLPLGRDCDDSDPNRYPDNPEVCDDGHDEDCDPTTFGDEDLDGDGHHSDRCCNVDDTGVSLCGTDCDDDGQPNVFEGAPELCDDRDNDCDGTVDEDIVALTFGEDCDGDRFGVATIPAVVDCALPDTATSCSGGVWVPDTTDCDDTLATRNPGLVEVCDGIDNNCDGAMLVDEGLTFVDYYPDCDGDTHGDSAATPINACSIPGTPPTCPTTGTWVTNGTDCNDANAAINPGTTETCNAVDDDCDGLVDDITDGTVFCSFGQTQSCSTGCGSAGNQTCTTCVAWDICRGPEVCNGCDDDGDGAADEDFECVASISTRSCSVPVCGTTGSQTCSASCTWNVCSGATEVCNYCDDDGDGHFNEEKPWSDADDLGRFNCSSTAGAARCDTVPSGGSRFELWAYLLDGTTMNQTGAVWFTPADWATGWGPVTIRATMELTRMPPGGDFEEPMGGWSIIIAHSGTGGGVGTAQRGGIPTGLQGISTSWLWNDYTGCGLGGDGFPPSDSDVARLASPPGGALRVPGGGTTDSSCFSGTQLSNTANNFNGTSGSVTQDMTITYTPDDPTTSGTNEEMVVINAGANPLTYRATDTGMGGHIPSDDLPIGSRPLRIGITAGVYSESGFSGPPPGSVFGVPVAAKVRLWEFEPPSGPGDPTFRTYLPVNRDNICP